MVALVSGRFRGIQLFLIAENAHPLLLKENPFFKNSEITLAVEKERKH